MTPAALHKLLVDLPWDSYQHHELNEIHTSFMRSIATIRTIRVELQRQERRELLARRTPLTEEEIQVRLLRKHVYPPGQRFE